MNIQWNLQEKGILRWNDNEVDNELPWIARNINKESRNCVIGMLEESENADFTSSMKQFNWMTLAKIF